MMPMENNDVLYDMPYENRLKIVVGIVAPGDRIVGSLFIPSTKRFFFINTELSSVRDENVRGR